MNIFLANREGMRPPAGDGCRVFQKWGVARRCPGKFQNEKIGASANRESRLQEEVPRIAPPQALHHLLRPVPFLGDVPGAADEDADGFHGEIAFLTRRPSAPIGRVGGGAGRGLDLTGDRRSYQDES